MLELFAESIRLLARQPGATGEQVAEFKVRFPSAPDEYVKLVAEATEIEFQHESGQYLRIWGPSGCIEMDDGYGITKRIAGAIPIGDDGGGKIIFYWTGKCGFGLHHVGYGNLDAADAIFMAPGLSSLLEQAVGFDTF